MKDTPQRPAQDAHDYTTQDPALSEPGMDAATAPAAAAQSAAGQEEKVIAT